MSNFANNFLQSLFWEFDLSALDFNDHKQFIIERVLDKGRLDSIKWLFTIYSMIDVKNVIESSKNINLRTKNFWSEYFKYAEYNT